MDDAGSSADKIHLQVRDLTAIHDYKDVSSMHGPFVTTCWEPDRPSGLRLTGHPGDVTVWCTKCREGNEHECASDAAENQSYAMWISTEWFGGSFEREKETCCMWMSREEWNKRY